MFSGCQINRKQPRMKKVIITSADVQNGIGIGERQARNIIAKIRARLNKEKHQIITVQEFCDYYGVKYDDISPRLLYNNNRLAVLFPLTK